MGGCGGIRRWPVAGGLAIKMHQHFGTHDSARYPADGCVFRAAGMGDEEKIDILRDKGGRYNPKERQGN